MFLTYKSLSVSSVLEDIESLQVFCIPSLPKVLSTCSYPNIILLGRMPYLEARSIP